MVKRSNIVLIIMALLIFPSDRSFANLSGGGLFASPNRGGGGRSGPTYYSFEDLRNHLRDKETFHFENGNRPANALVSLGYFMTYSTCASKNSKIAAAIKANPSQFKIDSSHIYSYWREGEKRTFDWRKYRNDLCVGDLIFTRGDDKLNNLAKFFSNWTHVVIVSNPDSNLIFDSTLDHGVQEHKVSDQWQGFGYFTCKRIDGMPYGEKYLAVQSGVTKYSGLPYLPKIETAGDIVTFVYKWCDKNDKSSMYCSKLAYNVLNPYMSIDTRRTSVDNNSRLRDTAPGNYLFSWIGVSPDNIYYSPSLAPDFDFSDNIGNI